MYEPTLENGLQIIHQIVEKGGRLIHPAQIDGIKTVCGEIQAANSEDFVSAAVHECFAKLGRIL